MLMNSAGAHITTRRAVYNEEMISVWKLIFFVSGSVRTAKTDLMCFPRVNVDVLL